ncbi:hypothetical protein, partial [Coprococcus eutactus]|uniref:hypothetical protein n=1 Tax=Coprococcus eutactus TaxID=33043 RepID=UPI00210A895C
ILNNVNGKNAGIKEFTFNFNFPINIKRVRRIMREHSIKADIRQKKHNLQRQIQQYKEDNLLKRRFDQPLPN